MVEDITVGKSSLLTPSLTQLPSGELRFNIIRTEPFGFGFVIIPFTLAVAGIWSRGTGPYAKPFVSQSAIASVT